MRREYCLCKHHSVNALTCYCIINCCVECKVCYNSNECFHTCMCDDVHAQIHTISQNTQLSFDIFLSARYQRALIHNVLLSAAARVCSIRVGACWWWWGVVEGIHLKESEYTGVWGASFFALLHRVIMEWVIQPSGKCSIRRQMQSVPTGQAPHTQPLDATRRQDYS